MKIFVPRFVDKINRNAQNINAQALLRRWANLGAIFFSVRFTNDIPAEIRRHETFKITSGRFWPWHIIYRYLGRYDAIFYPGHQWFDLFAFRLVRLLRPKTPVVATLEGIPWMTPSQKQELEDICGHSIFTLSYEASKHYTQVLSMADRIIAISPFLAKVGRFLYGDKLSVVSLGIDSDTFFFDENASKRDRVTVICAATVYELKRPWLFVELANSNPDVDFFWFGEGRGVILSNLRNQIDVAGLTNIYFKASVSHSQLAHEFRKGHLFVLPSMSEGVPKAAQEAAACGLPLVLFGSYEPPIVVHGENGYVVWDDQEFLSTVSSAVKSKERLYEMGKKSAEMAEEWDWRYLAPLWLTEVRNEIARVHEKF